MEVSEEMSPASPRRGRGDKCLLLVQSPGDYRQPWSRCLLTPVSVRARACFPMQLFSLVSKGFFLSVHVCLCAHVLKHVRGFLRM